MGAAWKALTTGGTEGTGPDFVRGSFGEFLLGPVFESGNKRSLDLLGMRLTSLGMTIVSER